MENNEEVVQVVDPGDKISVSLSYKKNLGNYQSLDIYTGVTVTVRDTETKEETYHRAWGIVEDEIENKLDEVVTALKSD